MNEEITKMVREELGKISKVEVAEFLKAVEVQNRVLMFLGLRPAGWMPLLGKILETDADQPTIVEG